MNKPTLLTEWKYEEIIRKQNPLTSRTLNGQVFGLEVDSPFSDTTFLACDDTVSALCGGT